jgi:hypothetical protein
LELTQQEPFVGMLALFTIKTQGFRNLLMTNTLAYFGAYSETKKVS